MFRSIRTKQFRTLFDALPANVQRQAEEAYALRPAKMTPKSRADVAQNGETTQTPSRAVRPS